MSYHCNLNNKTNKEYDFIFPTIVFFIYPDNNFPIHMIVQNAKRNFKLVMGLRQDPQILLKMIYRVKNTIF